MKFMLSRYEESKADYMKEVRKVFDMLFKLNETDLKLCCTYVELELGIYERLYDVTIIEDGGEAAIENWFINNQIL